MIREIAVHVASDFIFLVLLSIVGKGVYALSRLRALLGFFGVQRSGRLVIYLSHLRSGPWRAIGISGQTFIAQGSTVAYSEIMAAAELQSNFRHLLTLSGRESLPGSGPF